jgi:hypothetical protein
MAFLGLGHSSAKPKIHRCRGKEQRGKWRVPRAVKNVARDHEEIFPRVPGTHAPVDGDGDRKKDNEGERIEKHGWRATAYLRMHADGQYIFVRLSCGIDSDLATRGKIEEAINPVWLEK